MFPYLIAGAIGFVVGKLLEEDEAPKYADGGLIAPNGKPSNLTPEDLKLIKTIKSISTSSIYEEYNYKGIRFKVRYADHNESLLYSDFDMVLNITEYKKDNKDIILQMAKNKFDSTIFLIRGVNKNVLGFDEVTRFGGYVYLRNFVEKKYHYNNNGIGNREVIRVEGDYRIAMGTNEKVLDAREFHRLFRNVVFIDENNTDDKYADGGLIAPNGKPSNLTPEQYKLVRKPAFKNWFGDWKSKQFKNNHKPHSEIYPYDTIALDENGEPRIWHRATNYDYTEFDTEYIYLGSKKSYVKQYGKPKEFFIKPQKTIFIDNQDIERQKLGINFDYLAEYISDENGIPRKGKNYNKLKKAFENQKEVLPVWEYFTSVGNKEILNILKNWFNEYGFDSVMYWETGLKNNFGKYPVGLICLYFGNQIKLADGTNTTFDGKNPDIRFDEGGKIREIDIDVDEIRVSDEIGYFDDFVFNELEEDEILEGFVIKYYHTKEIGLVNVQDDKFELGVGYIWGLQVFEEYKGKGFGKKIIEKIFILHPTQYAFRGTATKKSKGFWLNLGAEFDESDEYSFILSKDKLNYSDGGSVLLAPNGKPSNLTPEQYKLVRTNEFKAWFGFWDLYSYGKAKNYYEPSVKKIAKELKEEKLSAINEAVNFLSKQVTENDVLIPMPSRYGIATDTRKLAQKISEKTGAKLFNCLVGKKRESVYEMKKNNQDLSNFDFKFEINCEIPKAKNYFIVDNVIGTGVTMKNALQNVIKNVGTNVSPLVFAIDLNNISKVVDSNGEPLVVYHGSKSYDIHEFDRTKTKIYSNGLEEFGTYFTDNKTLANAYKNWGELTEEEELKIDNQILKWKKILDDSRSNRNYDNAEYQINLLKETKKGKIYRVFINLKKVHIFDAKGDTNVEAWNNLVVDAGYKWATNRDAMEFLKEGKFGVEKVDGIVAINIVDAFVQTEELKKELLSNVYLVFDSENIKLADGTNKTFDSSNPDIRFEEGGITITDEFSTESYDFGNVGNSIKKNNLEVGQIQYDINKEKGIVSIYLLEVLEKGIGAKVINYFFNNGINIIYGDAVDSIEFWDKMGAKFDEFNEDINGYPFTISKEDFVKTKYYENTNPDIRFKRGGRTL